MTATSQPRAYRGVGCIIHLSDKNYEKLLRIKARYRKGGKFKSYERIINAVLDRVNPEEFLPD